MIAFRHIAFISVMLMGPSAFSGDPVAAKAPTEDCRLFICYRKFNVQYLAGLNPKEMWEAALANRNSVNFVRIADEMAIQKIVTEERLTRERFINPQKALESQSGSTEAVFIIRLGNGDEFWLSMSSSGKMNWVNCEGPALSNPSFRRLIEWLPHRDFQTLYDSKSYIRETLYSK